MTSESFPEPQMYTSLKLTKPTIVGLYGISGCGKTFLLNKVSGMLKGLDFEFLDGSKVINDTVPGGLPAFQNMTDNEKRHWRQLTIKQIGNTHSDGSKIVVVAGHYMFWSELDGNPNVVFTQADLETYSHIFYLDTPIELVKQRRLDDTSKTRDNMSAQHLERWQDRERSELRQVCYQNNILYSLIHASSSPAHRLQCLLFDLKYHTEAGNKDALYRRFDHAFSSITNPVQRFLVIDGDRTLTEIDTGSLFWDLACKQGRSRTSSNPLKTIFSSPMGYSYKAFEQAALLYEDSFTPQEFNSLCEKVSSGTEVYPQFLSLLRSIRSQEHVGIVLLTCGLQKVWEDIMKKEGLLDRVCVIGGGRFSHRYIVTGEAKAMLTCYIHSTRKQVLAFGDSVLDLPMLLEADQAFVVVGKEGSRSKIMEQALTDAIQQNRFYGSQILLPSTVTPRVTTQELPVVSLLDADFVGTLLRGQYTPSDLGITDATDKNAAKVLMTPMRDAKVQGPALREYHRRVGHYLAMEYLTTTIGIEVYPIPHVQGHQVNGYRLYHESDTMIVAMMRGGEPMAFGVSDALPTANFLHAKVPADIRLEHVEGLVTVILVDSVINTGKSIIEFVRHVNNLHATVQIVIMTGVAQVGSVQVLKELQTSIRYNQLHLIALRISDNKFTGKGTTDTGNRLFNTTGLT